MGTFHKRNKKYQEQLDASLAQPRPDMELVLGEPLPRHEDYLRLVRKWRFLDLSYRGGARYKNGKDTNGDDVLIKHEMESQKAWERRKRMSTCHNFCRPIIDKFVGFVFSKGVKRDESPAYHEWSEDVDGKKMCLHEFMRRATLRACILDRWYIQLDTTKPADAITQAQARAAGSRIVLNDLEPCRVIDWRENQYLVTDDSLGEYGGARLWDDESYQVVLLDKQGLVDKVEPPVAHGWSSCPIVQVVPHCSGESLIEDIAEHQLALFNLDSIHKEELCKQTFSQWWLAGSTINKEDLASVDVGSRRVLVLPVDANTVKFERLSSDPSQAESIRAAMAAEVVDIYRTLGLKDPTTEAGPESGRALKIRFTEHAFRAVEISDMAEDAESRVAELVGDALGVEVESAEYPEDFDEASAAEELDAALKVITASLPPTAKRLQVQKWATSAFTKTDEDEQTTLSQEIEEMYPSGEVAEADMPEEEAVAMGMKEETEEHPALGEQATRQLVMDHLRKDPNYYRPRDNDVRQQQNPAYEGQGMGSKGPGYPMRAD